ncbi:MAG TPA: NAD+ synthase [Blastocatellia bacterium]|jgi:NAD+ synthase (glutamine-hydrolysing)|nr:NAD+ synthase [Blastocatellia bacterium]
MNTIRVALAQINPTVGDFEGNTRMVLDYLSRAREAKADLVAFPELGLTGYPPEDLLLRPHFVRENRRALDRVIEAAGDMVVIVGFVDTDGSDIYNAAAVIVDGKLVNVYHKSFLPNYGVFDEERYFLSGSRCPVYAFGEARIGVNICEDIWYPGGPTNLQSLVGDAHLIVNISASPYYADKTFDRERMLCTRAEDNAVALAYCNLFGGQDELLFDGNSLVIDESGHIIARGRAFEEDLVLADINIESVFSERLHDPRRRREKVRVTPDGSLYVVELGDALKLNSERPPLPERQDIRLKDVAETYLALVIGTRDYVRKNGFDKIYFGLSGGIDSALTAVIAADAVGPENVNAVYMPTRYSASESERDSKLLAENLGIHFQVIEIEDTFAQYKKMLAPAFDGLPEDVTEENLQARIRGNILMALSNKFHGLVLSTGNKSEMSVGYSTLYGDMAGGFALLKDVPKTLVYELVHYVNRRNPKPPIPDYIITRPPSAELRPDQKDQDTLPPYPTLDAILGLYIEKDLSAESIASKGFPIDTVRWVLNRVDAAEYKRRQAPPGIKITPRAFGRDRRMPITNKFHG